MGLLRRMLGVSTIAHLKLVISPTRFMCSGFGCDLDLPYCLVVL